MSLSWALVLI